MMLLKIMWTECSAGNEKAKNSYFCDFFFQLFYSLFLFAV